MFLFLKLVWGGGGVWSFIDRRPKFVLLITHQKVFPDKKFSMELLARTGKKKRVLFHVRAGGRAYERRAGGCVGGRAYERAHCKKSEDYIPQK